MTKAKKPATKKSKVLVPQAIQNEHKRMMANGLSDVLGLNDSLLGFNPGSIGTQLTQVDTLFKNNRWYLISNMRQLLSEVYVEHGLVQTIVDVPVDDGMRGGIEIKSKQLDEEQVQELITDVERQDILSSVIGRAAKWNRLYGGAGVLILTDQDPEEPLDMDAIGEDTPLEFRAVDMWELFWDKQNTEGYNMELQEQEFEFYNYYAKKIHKSRVMKMKGLTAPSFIRPRLRGWGFSVVESLINSINQYLKANNLIFEVLDEFKVDVYKIKNLTNSLLSPQGEQAIRRRVQMANQQKNYQNAITMDGEDDFIQKELTFNGIAETMTGIRMQIASDMRMPMTKVFGISAQGFNSGEDDIENYNSMVESQVRAKVKYDILRILELMCKKKFGLIPEDLSIEFKPLRVLSSEQEQNVKTQKFTRAFQARQAGEITVEEFRDVINRENLLGIQLETDPATLESLEADQETNPDDADEGEEKPGANKPDKMSVPKLKPKTQPKELPKTKT